MANLMHTPAAGPTVYDDLEQLTDKAVRCALTSTPDATWKASFVRRCAQLIYSLGQSSVEVRWAPYQEFGIPDPSLEEKDPPPVPFTVGSVGYRSGGTIVIYCKT